MIIGQSCQPALKTTSLSTERVASPSAYISSGTTTVTSSPTSIQTSTQTYTPEPTTSEPTVTFTPTPSPTVVPAVTFAAIGDYGTGDQGEAGVAKLVLSWKPDFIITLGDNNYPNGSAVHIDQAIGQFFYSYIYPYKGSYGSGAEVNRFFPCLGNHDLITNHGQAYYDYFTLPGNERYYDFTWGPLHFFALDNIESEPDGVGVSSTQAAWLKTGLGASTSAWNIVYMHYPPYSSGLHGSTDWARWPYKEWGADVVLAGHDHTYERLEENGLPYFVNGLGGAGRYDFTNILDGSLVRYNVDYGAMRVEATETRIRFEFINVSNDVVDSFQLSK